MQSASSSAVAPADLAYANQHSNNVRAHPGVCFSADWFGDRAASAVCPKPTAIGYSQSSWGRDVWPKQGVQAAPLFVLPLACFMYSWKKECIHGPGNSVHITVCTVLFHLRGVRRLCIIPNLNKWLEEHYILRRENTAIGHFCAIHKVCCTQWKSGLLMHNLKQVVELGVKTSAQFGNFCKCFCLFWGLCHARALS